MEHTTLNVLHVLETLDMGGAEVFVVNMVNHLSSAFRSTICCIKRSGTAEARIERPDVRIIEFGKGEGNDFRILHKMVRLLQEHRIDVLHSHSWSVFCESAAAGWLAGTPLSVHTAHGKTYQYSPNDRLRYLKSTVRHGFERLLARGVHVITAVSSAVRDEIVEVVGIPSNKIFVVPNGVDVYPPTPERVEARRREINLKNDEVLILAVGRLAPVKNIDWLIHRFPQIKSRIRRPIRLGVIGDGPERSRIEATVERLALERDVILLGERQDVLDWMALADLFVLPSLYEGTSLALLEAMGSGLAVVATRVGGNQEVVRHGETGMLIESQDDEALVGAVTRLLTDNALRKSLGDAARQDISNRYSQETTVHKFEQIYAMAGARRRNAARI